LLSILGAAIYRKNEVNFAFGPNNAPFVLNAALPSSCLFLRWIVLTCFMQAALSLGQRGI
jgi:hypothetical protein